MSRHLYGFTLEVLLAVTLLPLPRWPAGFGVVRAAGATVARGELVSQRNEHACGVQFLRQRIGGAQGIVFLHSISKAGVRCGLWAGQRAVRFVADPASYLVWRAASATCNCAIQYGT